MSSQQSHISKSPIHDPIWRRWKLCLPPFLSFGMAESYFGTRAPGSPVFWKQKIDIFLFQKILKFLVHVDNDILHDRANFQPDIFCSPPYTKKTNLGKFELRTVHTSDPEICHFYTGQNTKYFGLKFYTAVEIVMFYAYDFFHIFLKQKNVLFNFFQNTGLPRAREPKHRTRAITWHKDNTSGLLLGLTRLQTLS